MVDHHYELLTMTEGGNTHAYEYLTGWLIGVLLMGFSRQYEQFTAAVHTLINCRTNFMIT